MTQQTLTFRTSEIGIDVDKVEAKYNAKFVGDFCLKGRNGDYVTNTAAVFWQETPPVEGYSHYFALVFQGGTLFIANGASAFDSPIIGVVARDGEIVYSRHRHDFRTSKDGSVTVDGGRDYLKLVGEYAINAKQVKLVVKGPVIEVHDLVAA